MPASGQGHAWTLKCVKVGVGIVKSEMLKTPRALGPASMPSLVRFNSVYYLCGVFRLFNFFPLREGCPAQSRIFIMAKGNMLLGYARGKVGDLVFTRRNGEQVTRPRVRVVYNPKSEGQQIQRMIFASVIAAYSRCKSICDHSFEGVKYGADSQAKFMSENLKRLRAFYPKDQDPTNRPIDSMAFVLPNDKAMAGAGLIIARGSIPAPEANVNASGVLSSFGTGADDEHQTGKVLEGLGAMPGDQITACAIRSIGNGYVFAKSRYVVKADATENELEDPWNPDGTGGIFDADKTEVNPNVEIFVGDVTLGNPIRVSNLKDDIVAAAIIISRRDESGNWLRSDAILYNASDEPAFYSAAYALPYWQFSGTDIATDDPHYLNNADI